MSIGLTDTVQTIMTGERILLVEKWMITEGFDQCIRGWERFRRGYS
jgi:hypothetical protein